MAECDECGRYENLPYQCRRCGNTFCGDHRLPENHDCPGLQEWDDPTGVFGGYDGGEEDTGRTRRASGMFDRATSTGGPLGYVRGNVAYLFLGLIWLVFGLEWLVLLFAGQSTFNTLFLLSSEHPLYVWTWVTSVFSHSPANFFHIVGNSFALFFFGPVVEEYVGSKKFAALFLVSGIVAGLAMLATNAVLSPGETIRVLGASGAVMAVLGVLTVLKPGMRILIFIPIPIPLPLWLFTIAFALFSVVFAFSSGIASAVGQGNVAHFAHLAGLVIGLAYGERVKGRRRVPDRLQFGGGRGGGRGPF